MGFKGLVKMMRKSELMQDKTFIEFMRRYYPFYSNSMLCKLIEQEYGIKLKVKDIERMVYELRKQDPELIKPKYPILLRKKILEKKGLPRDPTKTPNMYVMKLSKYLIIAKCINIINSIKNRKNVKNVKDIEDETAFITYKDMGGRQPSVVKYLCNIGVLEEWGGKTYICNIKKLLVLIDELKKTKDNFVEVYNGNGGENGNSKRYREIARTN